MNQQSQNSGISNTSTSSTNTTSSIANTSSNNMYSSPNLAGNISTKSSTGTKNIIPMFLLSLFIIVFLVASLVLGFLIIQELNTRSGSNNSNQTTSYQYKNSQEENQNSISSERSGDSDNEKIEKKNESLLDKSDPTEDYKQKSNQENNKNIIPVYKNAINVEDFGDLVGYEVKDSIEKIVDFYIKELEKDGWKLESNSDVFGSDFRSLSFKKGKDTINILLSRKGDLVSVLASYN